MLKLVSNSGHTEIKVKGGLKETVADVCVGLQAIYNALKEEDPDASEVFKALVTRCILEGRVMR